MITVMGIIRERCGVSRGRCSGDCEARKSM